jgi:hypothetical protein
VPTRFRTSINCVSLISDSAIGILPVRFIVKIPLFNWKEFGSSVYDLSSTVNVLNGTPQRFPSYSPQLEFVSIPVYKSI